MGGSVDQGGIIFRVDAAVVVKQLAELFHGLLEAFPLVVIKNDFEKRHNLRVGYS